MAEYTPSRLVRSFERHLRAENRSERTVENYLESLHQAELFLHSRSRRLEDATKADLEDFLADLLARRSASTAATRYKVLRILYRWLEEEEDVPSPMAKMKPPIVPERPVPVIPDDGLRRLLKVCEGKGFEARRDTVLIMLLLDTGGRRGELVGLKLADVDLDLDVLLVLGKGRRERALPFGHKSALALDRYLRVRDRHKHADLPWLWIGLRGRLTEWGLASILGRQACACLLCCALARGGIHAAHGAVQSQVALSSISLGEETSIVSRSWIRESASVDQPCARVCP